ncbi:MAG TPA: hypothetical protein ENN50_09775 [Prosthecochloris aestuarii]|uniref:Uncharacterized protein n=1 Tax=Prosthecochloris aestuarii TaxID=1102 RepID=A0A831SQR3_PROAE|nr:hypothetical protein [Prosthecochloris aestuarii]
MDDIINKAAGIASLAGSAVMFSPVGMPFVFHGLSGIVVGGLGLYAAGKVAGMVTEQAAQPPSHSAEGQEPDVVQTPSTGKGQQE